MSLPMIFAEKNISLEKVSFYSLSALPFSLKIFFAPFVDIFYSKSFGKRKSYIVPINYFLCLILFIFAIDLEYWIDQQNLLFVGLLAFLCCTLIAIQDVAVDSWALELLPHHTEYGSMSQSVGMALGSSLITGFGFNVLHSYQLITIRQFLFINVLIWLAVTLFVHFIVPEKSSDYQEESPEYIVKNEKKAKFKELIFLIKNIWLNKNMRSFIIILFLEKLWLAPVNSTFRYKLITYGVSKGTLSTMDLLLSPVKILSPFIFTKYFAKYNKIDYFSGLLYFRLFENIFVFIIMKLTEMKYVTGYTQYSLLFLCMVSWYNTYNVNHLIHMNFFYQITTPGFEGTVITSLNSLNNIAMRSTSSGAMYISDKVNYEALVITGFFAHFIFTKLLSSRFKELGRLNKKQWYLVPTHKNE